MRREFLSIFLVLLGNTVVGQYVDTSEHIKYNGLECVVLYGDTINCVDSFKLKQGFWKQDCQLGHHNTYCACDGHYVDGKMNGIWRWYDRNWKIVMEVSYKIGVEQRVKSFVYDKENNLLKIESYTPSSSKIKTIYERK